MFWDSDEDNQEDIERAVHFAMSIDAYQLQPAVLTPLPGTPVYDQLEKEGRLLTENWEAHDFMTVTFKPKQMTCWELQDEFFKATKEFYNFHSSFKIEKLFGAEYGWRRFWSCIECMSRNSRGKIFADHIKNSYYYYLKHLV